MMALDEEAEIMDWFNELRTLGILMRNCDGDLDTEAVAGVGEIIFDLIRDIPALVDRIDAETRRKKAGEKAITEKPEAPREATQEPTEAHSEDAEASTEIKGLDDFIDSLAAAPKSKPDEPEKTADPQKRKGGRPKKGESPIDDAELMKLRARGMKMTELAGHFGVSEKTIREHLKAIEVKKPNAVKDFARGATL